MRLSAIFLVFLEIFLASEVDSQFLSDTLSKIAKLIEYKQEQIDLFLQFKIRYRKNYRDSEDEAFAFKNFVKNVAIIDVQNLKLRSRESKFKSAIWRHTDMEYYDFMESFAGYTGRPRARLYGMEYPYDENIPKYLNYAEEGFVTDVQYQGRCGACWAFATTGALEAQLARKTGTLTKLSEQNLIDCNRHPNNEGNWGCRGGNMQNAYDYILKTGINPASSYPYRGRGAYACNFSARRSLGKIYDFHEVESNNETALMYALYHAGGPLAVAVDASDSAFHNYQSGVYDFPECVNDPNHAVLLVGYGVDQSFDPPQPYWLLKNSWGEDWGESGYFRLAKDANNLCKVALDASYPVVV